jgi:tetratricopeptide (TPR) repeat protein
MKGLARLAVILFLAGTSLSCGRSDREQAALLRRIDAMLSDGDLSAAGKLLSRADGGKSPDRWISILKRSFRLSRDSGDADRYLELALKAQAETKAPEITVLAAQALLESGRAEEASRMAAYAVPARGIGILADAAREMRLASLVGLDPARGMALPASDWAEFAALARDPGFLLNAVLSDLSRGNKAQAAAGLESAIASGLKAPAELAYDCGLYALCLKILPGDGARNSALRADSAYLTGDTDAARRLWSSLSQAGGSEAARAAHNLAALAKGPGEREAILRASLERFPADARARIDLAGFLADSGRRAEGLALMDALSEIDAENREGAVLVRQRLSAIHAQDAAVEASLLGMLQANPDTPGLEEYAVLELLSRSRLDAAFRIVRALEGRTPEPPWLSFALGCLYSAQGRADEAVKAFDRASPEELHYSSSWNSGAVLARMKRWDEAIKRLQSAVDAAQAAGMGREAALAYVFMGDCQLAQGSREKAAGSYRAALRLWPECVKASSALSSISK